MASDPWGHLSCPDCDLIICIHEDGWHADHDEPENDDFTALSAFVAEHNETHQ